MNEKERILKMVDDGLISPAEAAKLLAALQEHNAAKEVKVEVITEKEKPDKPAPMAQVQMQRPDGTFYTVEIPPGLVPAFAKMAGVAIKETVRTAATDAWDGFKIMVKNKTTEVKTNVSNKVRGIHPEEEKKAAAVASTTTHQEARRRIIQMVQNGRIGADDAARLIQQLDAMDDSAPRLA